MDLDLTTTNQALRNRGAKLTLYVVPGRGTIGVRGTWTDASGVRKQRKAGLGCPATPGGLIEAEQIATAMHQAISEGIDPTTVRLRAKHQPAKVIPEKAITVAKAIPHLRRTTGRPGSDCPTPSSPGSAISTSSTDCPPKVS